MQNLSQRALFSPLAWRFSGFSVFVLILIALMTLAGCGNASGSSADDLLAHTQTLHITDITMDMTVSTTYQGNPTTASGVMKFVVDPARTDAIITLTVAGKTAKVEEIDDISAAVVYAKSVDTPDATNTLWHKTSISDNGLSYTQILAFDNLSNTQLVGAEMQQNIPVWHIRGDIIGKSSTSTGDVYIRKDTYYPVKTIITDSGSTPAKTTLTYTAFNSGFSIALPPDNQVQEG